MENKKIKKLENYDKDGNLAMFEELQELEENTGKLAKIFEGVKVSDIEKIKGEKGDSIKGDKGDKGNSVRGERGEKPTTAELLKIIKPLIPKPIKGEDGKNADMKTIIAEVLKQVPEVDKNEIIDLVVKQLPTSGEAIRDSLELLQDDERIDHTAIKGLNKLFDKMEKSVKKIAQGRAGGGTPHNMLMVADLTSQCNGTTKSFQVPLHRKAIKVEGTQFPGVFRPTTDFTTANYTLTLTSEVGAPKSGQTLLFYYIK